MTSIVSLRWEPAAIGQELGKLSGMLENHPRIAVVREPASLEFRQPVGLDNFGYNHQMVLWKRPQERASAIQSVIDRNFKSEHLQQAILDIEAQRTQPYDRFFSLHLFRKQCSDNLRWLPQIYLKLWQTKNTFDAVLKTMTPHLLRLREIARKGVNQENHDDLPDIYFTSAEGEKVYAHSKWLSAASSVRNLAHPGPDPVQCVFPEDLKFSKYRINRFLDVVYGTCSLVELAEMTSATLDAVHDLANALGYEKLCDAIFKMVKANLDQRIYWRDHPQPDND